MKYLFMTLVLLNIVVFAGMIAGKMLKQHSPAQVAQTPAPTVIIHNTPSPAVPEEASGVSVPSVPNLAPAAATATPRNNVASNNNNNARPAPARNQNTAPRNNHENRNNANVRSRVSNDDLAVAQAKPKVNYKECSARVSMPADDYHRIKGLLARYPHAASKQVVDNGNGESVARMNVLFMQVSDQEASAIQSVVGRYGQLNRSACNR